MRQLIVLSAATLGLASLSGCAGMAYAGRGVGMGTIYADDVTAVFVTEHQLGTKTGEACATSILGLITTGDASLATAARNGGITQITAVDQKHTNIVGIMATYCLVVTGN